MKPTSRDEIEHMRNKTADLMIRAARVRRLRIDEGSGGGFLLVSPGDCEERAEHYESQAQHEADLLLAALSTVDYTQLPAAQ